MKANVSQEMKSRLFNAAANGSVIAKDVLAELKKECDISDIIRGSSPPSGRGQAVVHSKKSGLSLPPVTRIWLTRTFRTKGIPMLPGFRRTGRTWNRPHS